jgi:ACR3 family arsenite efflux pump ArsB
MSQAASFRIIAAPRRSIAPVFLYSPLTAADEKIPLSVVRVNNKPQHIVFCWYFAHLLSKPRHLPVESRKWPCLTR